MKKLIAPFVLLLCIFGCQPAEQRIIDPKEEFEKASTSLNRKIMEQGYPIIIEISRNKELQKIFFDDPQQIEEGPCGEVMVQVKANSLTKDEIQLVAEKLIRIEKGGDYLDTINVYDDQKKFLIQINVPYGFLAEGVESNGKAVLFRIPLEGAGKENFSKLENPFIKSGSIFLKYQNGSIEVADLADQVERVLKPVENKEIHDDFDKSDYKGIHFDPVSKKFITFNYPCT